MHKSKEYGASFRFLFQQKPEKDEGQDSDTSDVPARAIAKKEGDGEKEDKEKGEGKVEGRESDDSNGGGKEREGSYDLTDGPNKEQSEVVSIATIVQCTVCSVQYMYIANVWYM